MCAGFATGKSLVAQISNLLYRRLLVGWLYPTGIAPDNNFRQTANPRGNVQVPLAAGALLLTACSPIQHMAGTSCRDLDLWYIRCGQPVGSWEQDPVRAA
jgi:hypothetical protein